MWDSAGARVRRRLNLDDFPDDEADVEGGDEFDEDDDDDDDDEFERTREPIEDADDLADRGFEAFLQSPDEPDLSKCVLQLQLRYDPLKVCDTDIC